MKGNRKIRIMYRDKTFTSPLYYPGAAHGFLCAPARSGKFTCALAQILAEWKGSVLVIDPKGQACGVTARYREKKLGQEVWRLDPFNLMPDLPGVRWTPRAAQIDPMVALDPRSDRFATDADNIGEALVPDDLHGSDPHWTYSTPSC